MHDGIPQYPIQGQGQGHEWLKATQEESTVSTARQSLRRWTQGTTYIRKGGRHVGHSLTL